MSYTAKRLTHLPTRNLGVILPIVVIEALEREAKIREIGRSDLIRRIFAMWFDENGISLSPALCEALRSMNP